MNITMNIIITKAMEVEHAYDYAAAEDWHSEGCYSHAIATAHNLGGIEIANSNDGQRTISFAPTRTFKFDDASTAVITYGGVFL